LPEQLDQLRMDEALTLARRGWGQAAPNPLVGAVLYSGSERIAEGFHARFGEAHAEAVALANAAGRANGATLYVTLEPCAHHGKTPPCVDAIIAAGVTRVVIATRDINPVAQGGIAKLKAAGIEVNVGVRESEALELNAPFFHSVKSDRPWVTLKLAISLDGAITGAERTGGWLTGEEARAQVQKMRAGADAIAVGVQTALADNPNLTARSDPPPRVPPLRIVFDRSARLSSQSILAKTARETPTMIITAPMTSLPADLKNLGVEQMTAHDVDEALRKLRDRGVMSLMLEGGAGLAASFLAGDNVDRLVIFRAPIILDDVMSTYAVRK